MSDAAPQPADRVLARELAAEQDHLDRVYARLGQLRHRAAETERDGYSLARVGNFGALVERDAMVFHAAQRRYVLDAEHEGLVFGRLDRRDGQVHHVGRLGVRGEASEPLVVDWRAPAAAAFYQATAADPQGVVRRRMIQSSGETVTGLSDDLLDPAAAPPDMALVGDGALLASLSRTTTRGMRDIVATIQREQDEAIRSPAGGVTIVSGGPGTGKTAVALHRAAYLLYADRSRFAGSGILVVGPSPVFVEYISAVLPSLGEDAATLRSLGSLVARLSPTERVDPPALASLKGSLRMRTVLERAARAAVPGGPEEFRLAYRGGLLTLDRDALDKARVGALPRGARRNEVRRAGFDNIFTALWRQAPQQLRGRLPDRPRFEEELSEHPAFRDFLRAWWPQLTPLRVLSWCADERRLRRWGRDVLSGAEVGALAGSFAALLDVGPTVADIALLDELDALLGRPRRRSRRVRDSFEIAPGVHEVSTFADRQRAARAQAVQRPDDYRDYAHIVVDEAQDVTPMQWRMLGRRGRHASWTVVGDPAQSAWTGDPAELARARDDALGRRRRETYTLSTNYRNSAEIFEVAAGVIRRVQPDLRLPVAVRSTGVAPRHVAVDSPDGLADAARAAVAAVLREVEGTVGVITALGRRDAAAGWLAEAGHGERLQVVTSLEAKGMEYDGVVLVEPAEILGEAASGARTLYVALSRATQRLTTVSYDTSWRADA
ncbi:DNA helicase [Pilimelia terevasa]|uniref:DNA helicase n=1 Tax=Pilimelia terevasa TaxID=53372 RepID=A0A8J3BRM7_9ACTN|nr:UvrD-helicase domain-containing protein [Pilimelia terevasa]GGK28531.1 DNA helicase [Pilimelia terevasa]